MKKALVIALGLLTFCVGASTVASAKGKVYYYAKFFEDRDFQGRTLTLRFRQNAPDLKIQGINDKISSVEYNIPKGWKVVMYENDSYGGHTYEMMERGSVNLPGGFNDKCTSIQWIPTQ